jgi:hypothetical protein
MASSAVMTIELTLVLVLFAAGTVVSGLAQTVAAAKDKVTQQQQEAFAELREGTFLDFGKS